MRRSIGGAPPAPSQEDGGREPPARDLLRRPAAESVRRILLMTLDRIEEAAGRLQHGADAEALHDFRVGLRRLRSLLRAFRALVAADLPGRAESRLRSIARATNSGRDAEVQAALLRQWLQGAKARPGSRRSGSDGEASAFATASSRAAASRMAQELERRREELAAGTIVEARRALLTLVASLRKRLGTYRVTVELAPGPRGRGPSAGSFAGEVARQVMAQWLRLRAAVEAVEGFDPPQPLHQVRIDAKRLRYLLEPLRVDEPEVDALLRTLRSWQDLLGEFQDAVVLERRVARRFLAATRRRARALVAEARNRGSAGASARARRQAPVSPRAFLPLLDLARAGQQRSWLALRKRLPELPAMAARIERLCVEWSAIETEACDPNAADRSAARQRPRALTAESVVAGGGAKR